MSQRLTGREAGIAEVGSRPPAVTLFRATLAYDGNDFQGWQLQRGRSARTIQGVVEASLSVLAAGGPVRIAAAGRTDTGVHALGQVISFELEREIRSDELRRALNALLPPDVRALEVREAPAGFHARRSAVSKLYRYELDMGEVQLPTRRRLAGHVAWILDSERVRDAAALYVGRHDFASLASAGSSVRTTVREVTRSEVRFRDATLVYEVEADGFLRKMVRSMVGGLVAVGRGACSVSELREALERHDRRGWPPPVPGRGLTLVRVLYREGSESTIQA